MKKLTTTALIIAAGIAIGSVITSQADGNTSAGSVDDPIITKSYLDEQLKRISSGGIKVDSPPPSQPSGTTANDQSISIIKLEPKQTIFVGSGAEVIVRTGKTILVSSDEMGVPDVTIGKDIAPNSAIELNHLLIFPRDGRGIKVDPSNKVEVYVMIKGSYLLHNDGENK